MISGQMKARRKKITYQVIKSITNKDQQLILYSLIFFAGAVIDRKESSMPSHGEITKKLYNLDEVWRITSNAITRLMPRTTNCIRATAA